VIPRHGFAALLALLLAACAENEEPTQAERALLVTEASFSEFGVRVDGAPRVELRKTFSRLERARELVYTFNGEDLYLSNTLKFDSSAANASLTEKAQRIGLAIGLKPNGIDEKTLTPHAKYGDSAYFALLMKDGKPVGNALSLVSGNKVYLLVFSGIHFSEPADFHRFIGPKVDAIVQYVPAAR
jgi:hypothetical protein